MGTAALVISDEDRATLVSWARSRAIRASHVERAQIVLAVADGKGTSGTAREVGVSRPTVIKWRDRFAGAGIAGLDDDPRPGRPKTIDDAGDHRGNVGAAAGIVGGHALVEPVAGKQLGVGDATVARAWRKYRVQPWRRETFKFSTDPELEAKVRDVVGLYLNPPTNAIVLCVDEKSQIQALNRTAPILPLRQGCRRRRPTTTGATAPRRCSPRWRSPPARSPTSATTGTARPSSCDFLKKVAKAYPRRRAARGAGQLPHPQAR
jgi:hypothetical protein